jgi:STE24 endopeptidase
MKKTIKVIIGCYLVYAVVISLYLLYGTNQDLPVIYKGSAADPEMFMSSQQLMLSEELSTLKNIIYFIRLPLEWGAYLILLLFGLSKAFHHFSAKVPFSFLKTAVFVFFISLFVRIIHLPIDLYSYRLSVKYGISTQSIFSWLKDVGLSFIINYLLLTIIVATIYFLMKKFRDKWWVYTWLLSVPFTVFFMYIQPVVIAPLYNDFYPLKNKALESKILSLADEAEVPANRVYEVNMSQKTNAMNAYVSGIGDHLRIVLWDTTLQRLEEDEVLFIMAHEIGHYVKNHLLLSLLGSIVSTFIGLYLSARILKWMMIKWGSKWHINKGYHLASLPALLLIFSLLTFASTPIANVISRYHELEADRYAIEMTKNPEAAIGAFQELTKASLSDVNPPTLVKWIRYTHPTMLERLLYLDEYRKK